MDRQYAAKTLAVVGLLVFCLPALVWSVDPAPGYIGSKQCALCHQNKVDKWMTTNHSSIYREATDQGIDPSWVISDWSGEVTLSDAGNGIPPTTFVLDSNGGQGPFVMTIKSTGQQFTVARVHGGRALARNEDPAAPNTAGRSKYIGKQRYHTKIGDNYMILPLQWNPIPNLDGKNSGWVPYHLQDWIAPDGSVDIQVSTQSEERRCAGCHQTGIQVEFNETTQLYEMGRIEPNIACEACHGPGQEHVANLADESIRKRMNPDNLPTYEQKLNVCIKCHSRVASIEQVGPKTLGYPYNNGRTMVPGDLIADFATDAGGYWGSGISSSHHQQGEDYAGHGDFMGSEHAEHEMTCWSCHNPHGSENEHDLITTARDNSLCLQCHSSKFPDAAAIATHSHHPANNPESPRCIDCHMSATQKSAVKYDIHQHSFRVLTPAETLQHAQPNACAMCHRSYQGTVDEDITKWDEQSDVVINTWLNEEFNEFFGVSSVDNWDIFK